MNATTRPLTERQRNVLNYIAWYVHDRHRPPTMRDIARDLGISSLSVVAYTVGRLIERGLLTREPGVARGLRVAGVKPAGVCPTCGRGEG